MRVLHFLPVYVPAWQFGGPILSVSRLCEGLARQGVDVRVITTNAGLADLPVNQLGVPVDVNGVQVIYYPVDHQGGSIRSKALVESLQHHMSWAELLHLSSIWQPLGVPVQTAAHAAGVPVIQSLRGALGPYSWQRGWWKKVPYFWLKERPLIQKAAALHCTTKQEAREIAWLHLKPPIHLLPNPLDLSQLRYDPDLGNEWRRTFGIPLDQPLFLVAGRLHHKKGLDMLPKVLQSVSQEYWHILFLGQDEDGTGRLLNRELHQMGLSDRVHWLDSLPADQLVGPYNAADWLLLPSHHENFGNVVVEALACGCGALISDSVGVSEMLDKCPGVTVTPRTTLGWSLSIEKALASSRPSERSRSWVINRFSSLLVAQNAINTYSSLV